MERYVNFAARLLGITPSELIERCESTDKFNTVIGTFTDFSFAVFISSRLSKEYSLFKKVTKRVKVYGLKEKFVLLIKDVAAFKEDIEEIAREIRSFDGPVYFDYENVKNIIPDISCLLGSVNNPIYICFKKVVKNEYKGKDYKDFTLYNYTYNLKVFSDGWREFFKSVKPEIKSISKELESCENVHPNIKTVYKAFDLCPLENLKVVILGQDPYPNRDCAMGLSFSVPENVPLPPSLVNIFKELNNDGFSSSKSGDLTKWAKQGVLLVNTALTIENGKSNSHSTLWKPFTSKLIQTIINSNKDVIFILWGREAQRSVNMEGVTKIESTHPSPLAVANSNSTFFGSKPFSRCNDILSTLGKEKVDWNL